MSTVLPSLDRVLADVAAERRRQIELGRTPANDDAYQRGELADAAACYLTIERARRNGVSPFIVPALWPWFGASWKPSPEDRRKELVKAAALTIAEIERIDRADACR